MSLRRKAHFFAETLITASAQSGGIDVPVALGPHRIDLSLAELEDLGELISESYLRSLSPTSDGKITVLGHNQMAALSGIEWARPWIESGAEIPQSIAYPYRIFFDRVVGQVYVLDQRTHEGAIWVRRVSEMDMRSYVTPFRLMFSWLSNLLGIEVLHAASVANGEKGWLIMGPAGAGKSTLALWLGQSQWSLLADDLTVFDGSRIYPLFSRAKIDKYTQKVLGIPDTSVWRVPRTPRAKSIITIPPTIPARLSAILLPIRARRLATYQCAPDFAFRVAAPASLQEILGGSARNHLRLAKMFKSFPSVRVLVSDDFLDARDMFQKLASKHQFVGI